MAAPAVLSYFRHHTFVCLPPAFHDPSSLPGQFHHQLDISVPPGLHTHDVATARAVKYARYNFLTEVN